MTCTKAMDIHALALTTPLGLQCFGNDPINIFMQQPLHLPSLQNEKSAKDFSAGVLAAKSAASNGSNVMQKLLKAKAASVSPRPVNLPSMKSESNGQDPHATFVTTGDNVSNGIDGMQCLGKVKASSIGPRPINLPSLRSESTGQDSSANLVSNIDGVSNGSYGMQCLVKPKNSSIWPPQANSPSLKRENNGQDSSANSLTTEVPVTSLSYSQVLQDGCASEQNLPRNRCPIEETESFYERQTMQLKGLKPMTDFHTFLSKHFGSVDSDDRNGKAQQEEFLIRQRLKLLKLEKEEISPESKQILAGLNDIYGS